MQTTEVGTGIAFGRFQLRIQQVALPAFLESVPCEIRIVALPVTWFPVLDFTGNPVTRTFVITYGSSTVSVTVTVLVLLFCRRSTAGSRTLRVQHLASLDT